MCIQPSNRRHRCHCGARPPAHGLHTLARVVVWLTVVLLLPALALAAIAAYRWLTGAPWRSGPRRRLVTRPVRAAGQTALTATAVAALIWPTATLATLAALTLSVTATAWATRARARTARRPHRVRATVTRPPARPPARRLALPPVPHVPPVRAAQTRTAGRTGGRS